MGKEAGMNEKETEKIGRVRIAEDVVPVIAALAATEVDGVIGVSENLTNEIISRMGIRKAPKGVTVKISGRKVKIDMALGIDDECNVPETSARVQDKVKFAVESMTGLNVVDVNIRIAAVSVAAEY